MRAAEEARIPFCLSNTSTTAIEDLGVSPAKSANTVSHHMGQTYARTCALLPGLAGRAKPGIARAVGIGGAILFPQQQTGHAPAEAAARWRGPYRAESTRCSLDRAAQESRRDDRMLEQNAHVPLAIADEGHALTTGRLVPSGPASEPAQDPRIIETSLVSVVS